MCVSPITIVRKNTARGNVVNDVVPCGKCSECIKKKATSWGIRAYRESLNVRTNHFITLTYDNENLPLTPDGIPTLEKGVTTLFMKRFRSYIFYHYGVVIRFFSSAEYGSRTHRPHYHFLVHGLPSSVTCDEIREICLKLWRRCSIVDVQIPKNSSSGGFYVGKYCGKTSRSYIDKMSRLYTDFVRPYKRASVGYGNVFSQSDKDYYLAKDLQDDFGESVDFYRFDSSAFDSFCRRFKIRQPHECVQEILSLGGHISKDSLESMRTDFQKFQKQFTRVRDGKKFAIWFRTVVNRYAECHRPLKDGSFVNIKFPDYLGDKLYGKDLHKSIKYCVRKLRERYEESIIEPTDAILKPNSFAATCFSDYLKQDRYTSFDDYLYMRYHMSIDNTRLRQIREDFSMYELFSKDRF